MVTFTIAVILFFITPGPAVLSVAGVGSAFGSGPGIKYIAGLWVGTNLVAIVIVSGLAATALENRNIQLLFLTMSLLYLSFLAAKIAFAGTKVAFSNPKKPPGFMHGVILQIINPKAYAVGTALFTGFPIHTNSLALETGLKFVIINAIWIPMHFVWLYAGVYLRKLNLSPYIQKCINIFMALSMLIVVVLALLSGDWDMEI